MACPNGLRSLSVKDVDDAFLLADTVNCTGGGNFSVNWNGRIEIEETISISDDTTLSIYGNGSDAAVGGKHIMQLFQVSFARLTLTDLILENGHSTSGGAILADSSSLILVNCNVSGNSGSHDGGAIALYSRSDFIMRGTNVFWGNTANTTSEGFGHGGAVYVSNSTVLVGGISHFRDNSARAGGAFAAKDDSRVNFTGEVNFVNNTSTLKGGAVYGASSNLTIRSYSGWSSSSFVNNRAEVLAGAIYWRGGGMQGVYATELWRVSMTGNSAQYAGAAFFKLDLLVRVESSTFEYNNASKDGGAMIMMRVGDSDSIEVASTTFQENYAGDNGGALVVVDGEVTFEDSSFVGNLAGNAGGGAFLITVYGDSYRELIFNDCLFVRNEASTGPAIMSFDLAVDADALSVSNTTFFDNTPLCGSREFVDWDRNESHAVNHASYQLSCYLCPDWSECQNCLVSNSETIYFCSEVLGHTSSQEESGNLATLELDAGYWRTSNNSKDILECFNENACVGGVAETCGDVDCIDGYCAPGYMGPYCAVCQSNYSQAIGHACRECSKGTIAATEAASVCVASILALAFFSALRFVSSVNDRREGARSSGWRTQLSNLQRAFPLETVKIVIVSWQIITEKMQTAETVPTKEKACLSFIRKAREILAMSGPCSGRFTAVANVNFSEYMTFLDWIKVIDFDIAGWISALGCHFQVNFYHRLLVVTISPIVLLGILALSFRVSVHRYGHDERSLAILRRKHLGVLLIITFLIYSTASSFIFKTFACDALDDGNTYLRADYSIKCQVSGRSEYNVHLGYKVYAGFMVFVYPLGIPALYAVLLCMRSRWRGDTFAGGGMAVESFHEDVPTRDALDRAQSAARAYESMAVDLWKPYKREYAYYEVVECVRRVMLTGVVVFMFPGRAAQVYSTFLTAIFFFVLSEVLDPYVSKYSCWMYRFGHMVVILSIFVALLREGDVSGEKENELRLYEIVLTVSNVALATAVAGESVLATYFDIGE